MNKQTNIDKLHKESTVNINGKITKGHEAKISIFDRGFLYGDSIYEVTFSQNGNLIFFDEHLERLFKSADFINLEMFITKDYIVEQTLLTLKQSKIPNAYVRIIVTRGETEISLDPNISFQNNLIIIVKPKPIHNPLYYTRGLNLYISTVQRNDTKATNPSAKSGNYLNNVMAIADAKKSGADDAIMVNKDGYITEGTTFNIWMIKEKQIITPPVSSGLLKGITRDKIITIAKKNALNIVQRPLTPDELLSADEVFISSSTKGIMPVNQINSVKYADQRLETNNLIKLYNQFLTEHISQSDKNYLE